MKHSVTLKFIAFILCSLSLVSIIFAGTGIAFMEGYNLYHTPLETIQQEMLDAALKNREEKTSVAVTYDEFKDIVENKGGFVKAMWCGDVECEEQIKADTSATSRCMPFEQENISDKCVCCGKPATKMVYWGRAY